MKRPSSVLASIASYCPYTMGAKAIYRRLAGIPADPVCDITNREAYLMGKVKVGMGIMLIGVFCPIFWFSLLIGVRGEDLMWNAIHSGLVVLFGAAYLAWYRYDLGVYRRTLVRPPATARERTKRAASRGTGHDLSPIICSAGERCDLMEQYTTLFRALSDETRFRMVILLSDLDLCVTQIQFALGVPQSTVSRHLTVLRNAGLVTDRRDGAWVYYTLAAPKNPVEEALFEVFRECLRTEQSFMADLAKSMVCLDEPRATIAKMLRCRLYGAASFPRRVKMSESGPAQRWATMTAEAPAFLTAVTISPIETAAGS